MSHFYYGLLEKCGQDGKLGIWKEGKVAAEKEESNVGKERNRQDEVLRWLLRQLSLEWLPNFRKYRMGVSKNYQASPFQLARPWVWLAGFKRWG